MFSVSVVDISTLQALFGQSKLQIMRDHGVRPDELSDLYDWVVMHNFQKVVMGRHQVSIQGYYRHDLYELVSDTLLEAYFVPTICNILQDLNFMLTGPGEVVKLMVLGPSLIIGRKVIQQR